jgi:hypothetical protein
VEFEFTPCDSLQYNSAAETAFQYLAGKAWSMMLAANVPILERGKVAIEAIKNATQLDGLRVVTINNVTQTRDKHMFGSLSRWTKSLRTWDEAGMVKEGKHGKTGDRGIRMMLWVTPTIVPMTAAACGRKRPIA